MPRARKVCSDPTCTNLQPCPAHERKPWAGSTRSRELPPDWEHRRQRMLQRDPICTLAIVCGGMALSTEVHHTGRSDDHRDESLAGTCHACHMVATGRQSAEARRALT